MAIWKVGYRPEYDALPDITYDALPDMCPFAKYAQMRITAVPSNVLQEVPLVADKWPVHPIRKNFRGTKMWPQ